MRRVEANLAIVDFDGNAEANKRPGNRTDRCAFETNGDRFGVTFRRHGLIYSKARRECVHVNLAGSRNARPVVGLTCPFAKCVPRLPIGLRTHEYGRDDGWRGERPHTQPNLK